MLMLFDRSGSMSAAFGTSTRFEVAKLLLSDVLAAYQTRINFGFQQFPRPSGCGPDEGAAACCVDPPLVPVGVEGASAIAQALAAAAPVDGHTPTAQALALAKAYFATRGDGVKERYVLLSTDGQPSCRADGMLGREVIRSGQRIEGPCVDALAAVDELRGLGVKVIVLGIGSDLVMGEQGAPSCLEAMARAGGVAREGGGGPAFFSATNPRELERALQRIFGAVIQPSCVISMSRAAPDSNNVAVFFDDKEVPFDRRGVDGWMWLPGSEGRVLEVFGPRCQDLERLQVEQVDIRYGCEPCTMPSLCR